MPVRATAAILLLLFAAVVAWFVVTDRLEYARFKALTQTRDRQRRFAVWIGKAFALFTMGSLLALGLTGQLAALGTQPPAFAALRAVFGAKGLVDWGALLTGFAIAAPIAPLVGWLAMRRRAKAGNTGPVTVGDIEPLMPRNNAERWFALLLSINAGVGEELFFRLALPLLIVIVTGQVIAAFIVAGVLFGAMHLYQGWKGVLATTVLGALFTAVYLTTGNIWIAVLLHALIDVNGLLVMPLLTRRATPA